MLALPQFLINAVANMSSGNGEEPGSGPAAYGLAAERELKTEGAVEVFLPDRDFHAPVDQDCRPDGNGQFNVLHGEACIKDRAGPKSSGRK